MKTWQALLEDYKAIKLDADYDIRSRQKRQKDELLAELKQNDKDLTRISSCEAYQELLEKHDEEWKTYKYATRVKAIIKNNIVCSLFHLVLPEVLKALEPWEGKPMGEKTKAKVREFLDKQFPELSIHVFHNQLRIMIHASTVVSYGDAFDTLSGKELLLDNKLCVKGKGIDDFWGKFSYIENIPKFLRELDGIRQKAVKANNEAYELIKRYNLLIVDGSDELAMPRLLY